MTRSRPRPRSLPLKPSQVHPQWPPSVHTRHGRFESRCNETNPEWPDQWLAHACRQDMGSCPWFGPCQDLLLLQCRQDLRCILRACSFHFRDRAALKNIHAQEPSRWESGGVIWHLWTTLISIQLGTNQESSMHIRKPKAMGRNELVV